MFALCMQVCDAISGARPGARKQVAESYNQRLKDLEDLLLSFDGVTKVNAIHAIRKLPVMVENERVTDAQTTQLSFEIIHEIQNEMT